MWSSHHRRDKNLKSLNCLPLDFFSSSWVWRYHCTIFNSSSLYEKIWIVYFSQEELLHLWKSLLTEEQNWLSAVPLRSYIFQDLKNNEHVCPSFPLLFPIWFYCKPPTTISPSLFCHLPLSCVCPRVSQYHLFIFPLLFYFFLQFSLDPLCFIDDLFFACYFLFSDVLLLVLDYIPIPTVPPKFYIDNLNHLQDASVFLLSALNSFKL